MSQIHSRPDSTWKLDAYAVSLDLARTVRPLFGIIWRFEHDLASQLKRSVASVALNLAEAQRRTGNDRAHLLTVALGSAAESRAVLEVATALGAVPEADTMAAIALADRVCAMLYRLMQRIG
jgi:four helix bundle protein